MASTTSASTMVKPRFDMIGSPEFGPAAHQQYFVQAPVAADPCNRDARQTPPSGMPSSRPVSFCRVPKSGPGFDSILSARKRTEPSQIMTLTPPPWRLDQEY